MLYLGKSHGKFINGGHSAVLSIHCAGYHTRKCHKILSVAVKIKHPWWVAQALGIDRHKRMFSTLNCEILFIHSEIWAHTYIYLFYEWKYGVCFFSSLFQSFFKESEKHQHNVCYVYFFAYVLSLCTNFKKWMRGALNKDKNITYKYSFFFLQRASVWRMFWSVYHIDERQWGNERERTMHEHWANLCRLERKL